MNVGGYKSEPNMSKEALYKKVEERLNTLSPEQKEKYLTNLLSKPFNELSLEDKMLRVDYKFQKTMMMRPEEHAFARSGLEEAPPKAVHLAKEETKSSGPSFFSRMAAKVSDQASKLTKESESSSNKNKAPATSKENKPSKAAKTEPSSVRKTPAPPFQPAVSKNTGISSSGLVLAKEGLHFEKASPQEIQALQAKMQNINKFYPELDVSKLPTHLKPEHKMQIGNATFYCSNPVLLEKNKGVVALVVVDGKVFPAVFYESRSQGCWRLAPGIDKKENMLGFLNKGIMESDTQLPIALNGALHNLTTDSTKKGAKLPDLPVDETHALVQTRTKWGRGRDEFTYYNEVKPFEFIESAKGNPRAYADPESMKMKDPNFAPDFKKTPTTFEFNSPVYGKLTGYIYPSKNESAQFLFYKDQNNKVFLSHVECVKTSEGKENPITRYGGREYVPELEDLDAPLFEYPSNMDDKKLAVKFWPERNQRDPSGSYLDFWKYVKEIPIINDFYEASGIKKPS